MKLLRYKKNDETFYGKLEGEKINKIAGDIFSDYELTGEMVKVDSIIPVAPLSPSNIIAIGLNYKKHADESGSDYPERPVIFIKATSSLNDPEGDIILPAMAPDEVDYEAELAVVIGKNAKNIEIDEVDDYILGYTCANDVTARDCQRRLDEQWARAKSFDTFCPLGPWIETDLEPDNVSIRSVLNGKIMQDSNTSDMIFNTRELVSYCSKNMTLLPGTVILTGTPEGVGFAREHPVFLRDGDIIEIEIEGIGKLRNTVSKE